MRNWLSCAFILILVFSGAAFAGDVPYGQETNQTYIYSAVDKHGGLDNVSGKIFYVDYSVLTPEQAHSDIVTGTMNTETASAKSYSGPLDYVTLTFEYTDVNGNRLPLGEEITDENGTFSHTLAGVDFVLAGARCTKIIVSFATGPEINPERYGVNPDKRSESVYCQGYDYALPFTGVDLGSCVPVVLIFGVLAAAMYASGSDPLRAFDISTPRLPKPKDKPAAFETRFGPGWKIQRLGALRAKKESDRNLRLGLERMDAYLSKAGTQTGGLDRKIAALMNNRERHKGFIRAIMGARQLSWQQRSLLIELLYLGKGNREFRTLTGEGMDEVKRKIESRNSREISTLSRAMTERTNTRDANDVKNQMKDDIGSYERRLKLIGEKAERNKDAYRAFQQLSFITGTAGLDKPGLRDAAEITAHQFETGRKWSGLSSKWKPADKVLKFIATAPGLRGEFASGIGSVRLVTGIGVRAAKAVAVEGIALPVTRIVDKGFGKKITIVRRTREFVENKMSVERKVVGTAVNSFELTSREMRSIIGELLRKEVITKEEARKLVGDSTDIFRRADKNLEEYKRLDKRGLGREELKREQARLIQAGKGIRDEYRALVGRISDRITRAVSDQRQQEDGGTRYKDLMEYLNAELQKQIGSRGLRSHESSFVSKRIDAAKTATKNARDAFEEAKKNGANAQTVEAARNAYRAAAAEYADAAAVAIKASRDNLKDISKKISSIVKAEGEGAISNATRDAVRGAAVGDIIHAGKAKAALRDSWGDEFKKEKGPRELEDARKAHAMLEKAGRDLVSTSEDQPGIRKAVLFKKPNEKDELATKIIDVSGYQRFQAIGMLNKWLDISRGEVHPGDAMLSEKELQEIRKRRAKTKAEGSTVTSATKEQVAITFAHQDRRKLTGRIEALLGNVEERIREIETRLREGEKRIKEIEAHPEKGKEGRKEIDALRRKGEEGRKEIDALRRKGEEGRKEIARIFEEGAFGIIRRDSEGNAILDSSGNPERVDVQAAYFSNAVRIDEKDKVRRGGREETEFGKVLNGSDSYAGMSDRAKAEKIADLLIDSSPWYRKRRVENVEALIADLGLERLSSVRGTRPEDRSIRSLERSNFLGVNAVETQRRLNAWLTSSDELLARGILPGSSIKYTQAAANAWYASPEGFWLPASATKPRDGATDAEIAEYNQRRNGLSEYIVNNLAQSYRLIYGATDGRGNVDSTWDEYQGKKGLRPNFLEKVGMESLLDLGMEANIVKAAVTQSWMTIQDLNARYMDKEIYLRTMDNKRKGEPGKITSMAELKGEYLKNQLGIDKLKFEAEMKIHDIKERVLDGTLDDAEKARLKREIHAVQDKLKTDLEARRTEMRYQRNVLRSLAYTPSVFQAITRKGPAGQDYSSTPEMAEGWTGKRQNDLERLDNWARSKYGQDVEGFDPAMARLSKDLARSHYEINFLGVIPVRSGRTTSSGYGMDGYISTGQAAFGPGLMDPKRGNWVNTEWSEMDAISSTYQGQSILENIPVIRHLTYGNFLRSLAYLPVKAAQPIVGASRLGVLKAEGLPSPYEPQYVNAPDWKGGARGFVQAIGTYAPFPLNLPFAATAMMNPSKGGRFSYRVYEAFSRAGFRNYAMEGKTDWATLYAGGPNARMGYIDKFYTSTYAGGYQPQYFNMPFGELRIFPGWAAATGRSLPGFMQGRADAAYSNIFRTETTAHDMQVDRNQQEEGQGAKRELVGLLTPVAVNRLLGNPAQRVKRGYDQLAHNMQNWENYKETSKRRREEEINRERDKVEADRRRRENERIRKQAIKKYSSQKRDV